MFGRTLNPRNRTLTSGGSSGGEAALLALKGSILGVGTDYGMSRSRISPITGCSPLSAQAVRSESLLTVVACTAFAPQPVDCLTAACQTL